MNKIQYIHRRKTLPGTNLHGHGGLDSRGGFTVAYREVELGLIEYSIATCSTRDNFNKKLGRDIATGRMNNNKVSVIAGVTMEQFRDSILYSEPV